MKNKKNGFALLIAVIFMSVMLSLGLALGSLAYKQQVLASSATESQYAFYAADAALECALYADQQNNGQQSLFAYQPSPASAPLLSCGGATIAPGTPTWPTGQWILTYRLSYDNSHCADVTVYKPPSGSGTTYLFAQGYDVSCDTVANSATIGARFVSRGLSSHY